VALSKASDSCKTPSPSNNPKSKKSTKKPKNRDVIFNLYKNGKSLKEIYSSINIKAQTIDGHILHIFEHYDDVDIDMEYFDLTIEKENKIKSAIKQVGYERLRPIKDIVGNKITYGQIKLCLLVMKIENE